MNNSLFFLTAFLLLFSFSDGYADQSNPVKKIESKQEAIKSSLDAKKQEIMAKLDAKIKKAKAAGKSTETLESKKRELQQRIDAKRQEGSCRINAKMPQIKRKKRTAVKN